MCPENRVRITLGIARHPSVMALIDGTVKADRIDLVCVSDFPPPSVVVRHQRILNGQLDGGEICLAQFIEANTRGLPLVGIPAYLHRSFRHRSIYCRDAAGIRTPADLRGKKVGLHLYTAATMVWARGILRDEFGVQPRDIRWFALMEGGVAQARRAGVSVEIVPGPGPGRDLHEHIAQMVERGELDAAVGPVNITRPGISRLFPNFAEVEGEYYRRTGIFPIIHTVVIDERIAQAHPWVPANLLKAFRKAAALAPPYAAGGPLEQADQEIWEVDRLVLGGDDPFSWVIGEKERYALGKFLDYLLLDGVIDAKPSLEVLFPYR